MGAFEEILTPCDVSVSEMNQDDTDIQIYPNPFTTSATIEYELLQPSTVQITIYNYLGEGIELIPEKRQPKGMHKFTWQAEKLPAGVYYCTLRIGSRMQTSKMIKL